MGDNQTGSLDVSEAAERMSNLAEEENEERDEETADDAEDDGGEDTEDGEAEPEGDDDEETGEAEEAGQVYTIKIDGKDIQVTEQELVSGYQRQADYTRKAMALADERKANEAELSAVRGERQQLAHWAQQMLTKLQREQPPEPNWDELRQNNPIEFAATWADHQRYQQQQAYIAQQYEAVMARNRDDEAKALQHTLATEAERLTLALPAWKDEGKANKEKAEMLAYGKRMGFSDDELNQVYDHRTVVVLRKAWLYDRLLSKQPQVAASRQSPTVAPPVSSIPRRNNAAVQASKRLRQTGSLKDAAIAIGRFL